MHLLTERAIIVCPHETGIVALVRSQQWVRINAAAVLVQSDPEQRPIAGCPNSVPPAGIKPCLLTLRVQEGYSTFVRIDGAPVCLDTVRGFTDGTPPGTHRYKVRDPAQRLARSSA